VDHCPSVPNEPPAIHGVQTGGCLSALCKTGMSATATDTCGGNLSYSWTPLDGGTIVGAGPSVQFDPPDTGPGKCPYRVELHVTSDATGMTSSLVVDIKVKLSGDVDGNGKVTSRDLSLVRRYLGKTPFSAHWDPRADVNCSGKVNNSDALKVLRQIGMKGGCVCQ
jgi:hypothetical protein